MAESIYLHHVVQGELNELLFTNFKKAPSHYFNWLERSLELIKKRKTVQKGFLSLASNTQISFFLAIRRN